MDLFCEVARYAAELKENGYCVIADALSRQTVEALDGELAERFEATPFCEGGFYGATTKRFGRLLIRSPRAEALVRHTLIVAIAEQILLPWCECIQLNTTQAIAVHGGAPAQLPHRDQDMWAAPKGSAEYLVNVMWPLTPFTNDNGATLIWPKSHGAAATEPDPPQPPIAIEIPPGAALLFLGSTLHCAGNNRTETVRRGIAVGYSLGWLKPYENQLLAYPPGIARQFDRDLARLVGYRQHRPNLGNFEGQCPSVLLGERFDPDRPLAAIDALRPDQAALVGQLAECEARQIGPQT